MKPETENELIGLRLKLAECEKVIEARKGDPAAKKVVDRRQAEKKEVADRIAELEPKKRS